MHYRSEQKDVHKEEHMGRRRGNGAFWALALAGGGWLWQNRDKVRHWAENNPQVRDTVNQVAQSNSQVRDVLEKQLGWQTPPSGAASAPRQLSAGGSAPGDINAAPTAPNYPATGETRRIGPSDLDQDARNSGR